MPKGWPDFTLPISIEAVAIATLPVDIKAQTVGNLNVNIAAQASALNLNVAVQSGVIDTRTAGTITNSDFENDFMGYQTVGAASIDTTTYYRGLKSCRLGVDPYARITQPEINPPMPTDNLAEFTVTTRVAKAGEKVRAALTYTDGTDDITDLAPAYPNYWVSLPLTYTAARFIRAISFQRQPGQTDNAWIDTISPAYVAADRVNLVSSVQLNVNIAAATAEVSVYITGQDMALDINIVAQEADVNVNVTNATITVTGTVSISGTVTVAGTVSVSGTVTVAGTVSISGTVTVQGSVSVSGTVSISGTVTITGTVNVSGTVTITGAVTITSGTVNVQTTGGANIIIDKLTQTAFTARRITLSNDNGVTSPNDPPSYDTGMTYRGKFYPRGCRGWLYQVLAYCKRSGSGTITINVSPNIGMGPVYSATITPSLWWDWKAATINKMWNYDSMFIWTSAVSGDVSLGYDTTEPLDSHDGSDGGATWTEAVHRRYFRASVHGETVGDVPVSGTINTVEIPHTSTQALYEDQSNPAGQETTIATIEGAGRTVFTELHVDAAADSDHTELRIYCDGSLAFRHQYAMLSAYSYGASTPGVSLTKYTENGECVMAVTLQLEFKRQLSYKALNPSAQNHTVDLRASYSLIK